MAGFEQRNLDCIQPNLRPYSLFPFFNLVQGVRDYALSSLDINCNSPILLAACSGSTPHRHGPVLRVCAAPRRFQPSASAGPAAVTL